MYYNTPLVVCVMKVRPALTGNKQTTTHLSIAQNTGGLTGVIEPFMVQLLGLMVQVCGIL